MIKIKRSDYLDFLEEIEYESVDFICIDPPYGKINGMLLQGQKQKIDWDIKINWKEMFEKLNKVLKPGGTIAVFGQQPTYSQLILSNIEQYKYGYVWVKNNCAQGFHSKLMPLIYTEDIAIFIKSGLRTFNTSLKGLETVNNKKYFNRWYAQQLLNFIGKSRSKIHKELRHRKLEFYFYFTGVNFNLLSEELYNELIEKYKINEWNGFLEYNVIKKKWEKEREKNKNIKLPIRDYSNTVSNVLHYSKESSNFLHPTQKPLELIEFLIATYSNPNDLVLDCFVGSGTTARACKNLNRNFIGCDINWKEEDKNAKL